MHAPVSEHALREPRDPQCGGTAYPGPGGSAYPGPGGAAYPRPRDIELCALDWDDTLVSSAVSARVLMAATHNRKRELAPYEAVEWARAGNACLNRGGETVQDVWAEPLVAAVSVSERDSLMALEVIALQTIEWLADRPTRRWCIVSNARLSWVEAGMRLLMPNLYALLMRPAGSGPATLAADDKTPSSPSPPPSPTAQPTPAPSLTPASPLTPVRVLHLPGSRRGQEAAEQLRVLVPRLARSAHDWLARTAVVSARDAYEPVWPRRRDLWKAAAWTWLLDHWAIDEGGSAEVGARVVCVSVGDQPLDAEGLRRAIACALAPRTGVPDPVRCAVDAYVVASSGRVRRTPVVADATVCELRIERNEQLPPRVKTLLSLLRATMAHAWPQAWEFARAGHNLCRSIVEQASSSDSPSDAPSPVPEPPPVEE